MKKVFVIAAASMAAVSLYGGVNYVGTFSGNGNGLTNLNTATTATYWTGIFDVTAYGAVGDGVTDNHNAIETAIQAALVTGGVVYFPARAGQTNLYVDGGPHYVYPVTNSVLKQPLAGAVASVTLRGEPQVALLYNTNSGVYLSGYFNAEHLIIQGLGSTNGVWPYPTNYVGLFLIGPWGATASLKDVSIFGFGQGFSFYEAQPKLWNCFARNCMIGYAVGRQNDTLLLDGCLAYNCSVGMETGAITPNPTNSTVGNLIAPYQVTGNTSVKISGLWDYNGIDFVLGGRYGSYDLTVYGEANTNANIHVGHNPAVWPDLNQAETNNGNSIAITLHRSSFWVNSPPENIKLYLQANMAIEGTGLAGLCAIHSYAPWADASVIRADSQAAISGTNILLSTGQYVSQTTPWDYNARIPANIIGGPSVTFSTNRFDNSQTAGQNILSIGGIKHALVADSGVGSGPGQYRYQGVFTWIGDATGFQWNNQSGTTELLSLDGAGNLVQWTGTTHLNGSGITNYGLASATGTLTNAVTNLTAVSTPQIVSGSLTNTNNAGIGGNLTVSGTLNGNASGVTNTPSLLGTNGSAFVPAISGTPLTAISPGWWAYSGSGSVGNSVRPLGLNTMPQQTIIGHEWYGDFTNASINSLLGLLYLYTGSNGSLAISDAKGSPEVGVTNGNLFGGASGLTNLSASALISQPSPATNLLITGGVTDTNFTTGSYTKYAGNYLISSNGATGSTRIETNASIVISNGTTGLTAVLTNGGGTFSGPVYLNNSIVGNGAGLTNLNVTNLVQVPCTGWMPTNNPAELTGSTAPVVSYSAGGFVEYSTNSYYLTNIQCNIGGNGVPTNMVCRIFAFPSWNSSTPPFSFGGTAALWTNTVALPKYVAGGLCSIPVIPATLIPMNQYIVVVFTNATGSFAFAYFNSSSTTNVAQNRNVFCYSSGGSDTITPGSSVASYASAGYILTGYTNVSAAIGSGISSAANLPYANGPSGLLANNAQGAIDQLATNRTINGWLRPDLLYDFQAKRGTIHLGGIMGSNAQATVCLIGDSWLSWNRLLSPTLSLMLKTNLGDAGIGWVSPATNYTIPNTNATAVLTGTWHTDSPTNSPCNSCATSVAAGDKWTVTGNTATNVVHYLQQPGGATLYYDIDAGSWTALSTAGTYGLKTFTIGNLDVTSSHTMIVSNNSSSPLTLFGCDMQSASNGVRMSALGISGDNTEHWTNAVWPSLPNFTSGLASLNPSVVIIEQGVNDQLLPMSGEEFQANLTTIATAITNACTNAAVVFLIPGETGNASANPMATYRNSMQNAAVLNGWSMIDNIALLGGTNWNAGNARGMWANTSHLSNYGYWVLANNVFKFLTWP